MRCRRGVRSVLVFALCALLVGCGSTGRRCSEWEEVEGSYFGRCETRGDGDAGHNILVSIFGSIFGGFLGSLLGIDACDDYGECDDDCARGGGEFDYAGTQRIAPPPASPSQRATPAAQPRVPGQRDPLSAGSGGGHAGSRQGATQAP